MTFEDEYSNFRYTLPVWSRSPILLTNNPLSESDLNIASDSPASQQSVILYAAPSTVPADIVSDLVSAGVGSLYITDLGASDPYASLPADFATFVASVASDQ